jgi:hypothetical protein
MNSHAAKEIALAIFGLLFVLSGIAGITLGGTSAQAAGGASLSASSWV